MSTVGESASSPKPPGKPASNSGAAPGEKDSLRWLHDKLERFEFHENELLIHRINTLSTILAALIAAEVVVWVYYSSWSAPAIVFRLAIPAAGVALSALYTPIIRRTAHAQRLWRAAAQVLEENVVLVDLAGVVSRPEALERMRKIHGLGFLRDHDLVEIDLSHPVGMYQAIFNRPGRRRSVDQSSPISGTERLPTLALAGWLTVEAATAAATLVALHPSGNPSLPLWPLGPVLVGLGALLIAYYLLRPVEVE